MLLNLSLATLAIVFELYWPPKNKAHLTPKINLELSTHSQQNYRIKLTSACVMRCNLTKSSAMA